MKIPNKRELQQISINLLINSFIHPFIHSFIHSFIHYSADINYKGFMKLYKKFTAKPYSFLVINTSLALDNTLRFKKNF